VHILHVHFFGAAPELEDELGATASAAAPPNLDPVNPFSFPLLLLLDPPFAELILADAANALTISASSFPSTKS
jgi:hypothetical protein